MAIKQNVLFQKLEHERVFSADNDDVPLVSKRRETSEIMPLEYREEQESLNDCDSQDLMENEFID